MCFGVLTSTDLLDTTTLPPLTRFAAAELTHNDGHVYPAFHSIGTLVDA